MAPLAAVPVVAWAVSALPLPVPQTVALMLGFLVVLTAMAGIFAFFVGASVPGAALAVLLPAGLGVGAALSAAELFSLAAPFKVVGALALGTLLGREVAERWWLVAAAVVALAVDLWSVFAGPTKAVVEEAPQLLSYLLVHFPAFGSPGPATALGTSDFVFVGLFAAGARRTGLPVGPSLAVMLASLPATLLLALSLGRPLPALPLLCLGFLAVHGRALLARG